MAISNGAFDGVSGRIAVLRPRAGQDLSALSGHDIEIVTGFFPDHEYFQSRGFASRPETDGEYDAALVFLPRAKAQSKALIAQAMALTSGGPVLVDGQKTDGIDSVLKACRKQGSSIDALVAKSHGKAFVLRGGDFSSWEAVNATKNRDGFWTSPGVFSAERVDAGSITLAEALPSDLSGRVADLGAGWGYLSSQVLKSKAVKECHLIEAEFMALQNARENISDPRAKFHWADARDYQDTAGFDHIVTNPPFHVGRNADPDLGRGFIAAAARLLRPSGVLWLVANRHLPYEQSLSAAFSSVEQRDKPGGFKVFRVSGSGSKSNKTVQRRRRNGT